MEKKYWKIFFQKVGNFFLAKKLPIIVKINILKFENRSSKNERIFLAPFNFLLLALVLRTSASGSFTASPSGCVNNKKLSRQNLSLLVRINILKFENRSSKNERILLARFIFSLLALVLRRYSSTSFADWPSGGYLLPKSSRATSFIQEIELWQSSKHCNFL